MWQLKDLSCRSEALHTKDATPKPMEPWRSPTGLIVHLEGSCAWTDRETGATRTPG
jgi:hypothetical protein